MTNPVAFDTARILDSYRRQSQDRAEVIPAPAGPVIVLADGAGGMSGGTEAADTVIMWVKGAVTSGLRDLFEPAAWAEFLAKLDYQISCEGGQTTAVVAAVSAEVVCGASVGDSAAWIVCSSGPRPARSSEDVGPWHLDLTKDQVRKPLLGSGLARPVAFRAERPRGTLLVASDGLVKYAPRDRVCRLALEKDLASAGRRMVDLARLRSGQLQDDVSLVLCRPREQRP